MRSPFIDVDVTRVPSSSQKESVYREMQFESPLISPEAIDEPEQEVISAEEISSKGEDIVHESGGDFAAEDFWLPFPVAELQVDGYDDPTNSGVPLEKVDDPRKALSKNFTVGEFARAQQGAYTWKFFRADPDLVSELQSLREAIGVPIIIVDGYYPPSYQKNVLKKSNPNNPHFSGRGIKIMVNKMTGIDLAKSILIYGDRQLSISVGEWSVEIYIKQSLPRITSFIADEKKRKEVIATLTAFDEQSKASDVNIQVLGPTDIPKWLISVSSPQRDPRITGSMIAETVQPVNDALLLIDKFLVGKSDTDKVAANLKMLKNFSKLSDDIAKMQGGESLAKLLKNDSSGIDFLGKLQMLKSSLGLLENLAKLSSISEKKKKYEEFLKNNAAAEAYISLDIAEGIIKMSIDSIHLGMAIAVVLTEDLATKASILETAAEFEKAAKSVTIFFEGLKILRSVTSLIIGIAKRDVQVVKDSLVDIGKAIVTIATILKYGAGIVSVITGAYEFYKFVFSTLPTMVGDVVRSLASGGTIIAIRELDLEFTKVTEAYVRSKYDLERTQDIIGWDDNVLAQNKDLQTNLWKQYSALFRSLDEFSKYARELYTTTRSRTNMYSSFPSIPKRIFANQNKLAGAFYVLNNYSSTPSGFSVFHADALNEYYQFFYEGIVKCHVEMKDIYEERVRVGWGHDDEASEIEGGEFESVESTEQNNEAPATFHDEALEHEAPVYIASLPGSALLPVKQMKEKTKLNVNQVKNSGISLTELTTALQKYCNYDAIRKTFTAYNQQQSGEPYTIISSGLEVDDVFTEAVRQFQQANYLDPKEHDGILGQSTLDTFGFARNGLKRRPNTRNFYGQVQLNSADVAPLVISETNKEFSASNWFDFLMKPAWLGVKITDGVHLMLFRKLKEAEEWLLQRPQYKGLSPAALGKALGFNKETRYSAARLSASKQAMHGFGLAIDINVWGNPWIGAGWIQKDPVLLKERTRMIVALRKASGNNSLPGETVFAYLHSISQSDGDDTSAVYNILKKRSDEFVSYLRTNETELDYWKQSQTFGGRNPLDGFLNLHPDLVYALRQVAGLAWGAVDFGPLASGDIIHFDMRTIGVGVMLCKKIKGHVPKSGHPVFSGQLKSIREHDDEAEIKEAVEEALWKEASYSEPDNEEGYEPIAEESDVQPLPENEINEMEENITAWKHASILNRHYAKELEWDQYYDKINSLLIPFAGVGGVSLGEEAFARALSAWQLSRGIQQKNADGILGPNTWKIMKPLIAGVPVVPSTHHVLPASNSIEQEWSNSSLLQSMYATPHSYARIREVVVQWGITGTAAYIEGAINDWNHYRAIQKYFGSFDGGEKLYLNNAYLNLKRLYQKQGIANPAEYFAANIVDVKFFNKETPCHRDLKVILEKAQATLVAGGNNYVLSEAYSFVPRTFNNNPNVISNHAMGKAIDINWTANPHITSSDEITVINAVCKQVLPDGLGKTADAELLHKASQYFQKTFNSTWISLQTDEAIKAAVRKRRSQLDHYAVTGFMNLPLPLVRGLQSAGLNWGGTWKDAKDFMHFEIA
jgi:hypothetical protein